MPKIEFRGKSYNNEFEMPYDVRQAYKREKERQTNKNQAEAKPLTDIVDMSPEVRAIYERALGNMEDKLPAARPSRNLPKTEDIYRQSAPDNMKDLPSDESIYRPTQPIIDPGKSAIEPESGLKRLAFSILWVLIFVAIIFFVIQFVP